MNPQNTPLTDGVVAELTTNPKYRNRPAQKFSILQLHAEELERKLNRIAEDAPPCPGCAGTIIDHSPFCIAYRP